MASANAGLELPATSLMAPFLPVIPSSPAPRASRRIIPEGPTAKSASRRRPITGAAQITPEQKQNPDTSRVWGLQYESKPFPRRFFRLPSNGLSGNRRRDEEGQMTKEASLQSALCYRASLARQCDSVNVPAIVGLGAMRGAPIAEKLLGIGVGAQPDILDLADAGALEPRGDIAGEVEHGMAVAPGRPKEAARGRSRGPTPLNKIGADLVISLPDHRTDRRLDLALRRAKPLHCRDRRFDDPGQGAAPAGMGGPDHAGPRFGEEDRSAI